MRRLIPVKDVTTAAGKRDHICCQPSDTSQQLQAEEETEKEKETVS